MTPSRRRRSRRTVEIVGFDHVQIAMPRGEEALARLFYGGVLGLQEVRKLRPLSSRGGVWFVGPGVTVHLGVAEPFSRAGTAHPAFVVGDIGKARRRLAAHGVEVIEDEVAVPIRRCYIHDPFGNRIELVDAADAGFTRSRPRSRSNERPAPSG